MKGKRRSPVAFGENERARKVVVVVVSIEPSAETKAKRLFTYQ
jgi:hypothetical protein